MKKINSLMLIVVIVLLTGCAVPVGSSPAWESQGSSDLNSENMETAFFSHLLELKTAYGFNAMEEVDFSESINATSFTDGYVLQAGEDVQIVAADLLRKKEGLFIDFSFSQPLNKSENGFSFVFNFSGSSTSNDQLVLSADGLQVIKDGQVQADYPFQSELDWQVNTRYGLFLYLNDEGGLDVRVWPVNQPETAVRLTSDQGLVGTANLSMGVKPEGEQTLTFHNLWKMVYSEDAKAQAQAAYSAFVAALDGYQVTDARNVNELECEQRSVGAGGVFSWSNMTNEHCDLDLRMGQALGFDFVLANPVQEWSNIAFLMLDANLEVSDMPVKNLGIPLANENVVIKLDYEELGDYSYNNGFNIQPGIPYSALVVMNAINEFEIEIWPADDPEMRMEFVVDQSNVPPDWLPVEDEKWTFGMWIAEEQQVTISNLYHFMLAGKDLSENPTPEENGNQEQADEYAKATEEIATLASQEPEWITTGDIPNLSDFFISHLAPDETITCENLAFDAGRLVFPVMNEDLSYQCQMNLAQGTGFIFEFIYNGENSTQTDAHLLDLALTTGEGEAQKEIRFSPVLNNLILKNNDQYIDSYVMEGEINWEPGKRYTMVLIPTYNKYIYIWPSDNPGQNLRSVIDEKDWSRYFEADDPQTIWQLRLWVGAGTQLQIQNIYQFMAN
jgi:hypothetical protein